MLKSIGFKNIPARWGKFESANSSALQFSHINLIIGPNHSGKSRFARSIYAFSNDIYTFDYIGEPILEINSLIDKINLEFHKQLTQSFESIETYSFTPNTGDGVYYDYLKDLASTEFYSKTYLEKLSLAIRGLEWLSKKAQDRSQVTLEYSKNGHKNRIISDASRYISVEAISLIESLKKKKEHLDSLLSQHIRFSYIPILRGLKPPLPKTAGDEKMRWSTYKDRVINDYFKDFNWDNKDIITGLDFYDLLDDKIRGSSVTRKDIENYEIFLKDNFFHTSDLSLIPQKNSDYISVKIGPDEHPIFNFGDGLQNLIICTYAAFLIKEPSIFIIEEADILMHPGMQRKFIEVIGSDAFRQHQFFITTHSNHMIDIVGSNIDVSIFKCERKTSDKDSPTLISQLPLGDRSILEDLGVRNSSALIANKIIWVEGISDRLYIEFFLNQYFKKNNLSYLKDLDFLIMEYQGSNFTHITLDEDKINLEYIAPKSYFILDGDTEDQKPNWHIQLMKQGANFYKLPCKEIECLIPSTEWKNFYKDKLVKTSTKIAFGEIYDDKENNKYKSLATYFKKIAGHENESLPGSHLTLKQETFTKKADLARNLIKNWKTPLTPPINDLCEKIISFIKK